MSAPLADALVTAADALLGVANALRRHPDLTTSVSMSTNAHERDRVAQPLQLQVHDPSAALIVARRLGLGPARVGGPYDSGRVLWIGQVAGHRVEVTTLAPTAAIPAPAATWIEAHS